MKSEVLVVELEEQLSIFHHLLSCGATILGEHHHLVLTVVGLQNLSNGEGSMRCAVLNNCLHSCQGCRHLLGVHGVVLVVIEEDHVALPDRPDMSHAHEIRLALVVHHHGAVSLILRMVAGPLQPCPVPSSRYTSTFVVPRFPAHSLQVVVVEVWPCWLWRCGSPGLLPEMQPGLFVEVEEIFQRLIRGIHVFDISMFISFRIQVSSR